MEGRRCGDRAQQLLSSAFQRRSVEAGARFGDQDQADVHVHEHAFSEDGYSEADRAYTGWRGLRAAPLRKRLQSFERLNTPGAEVGTRRTPKSRQGGPMAWGESKAWLRGTANQSLYGALLEEAAEAPVKNGKRKKVVHPEEMPWELSRQGLLKHLINEGMNTRMETVDAYMLIIPPASRSGKHRHLAEECL